MQDGALNYTLKTQGGLCIDILSADYRCVLVNEIREQLAKFLHIGRACA